MSGTSQKAATPPISPSPPTHHYNQRGHYYID